MSEVYFLQITGTLKDDQKWFFSESFHVISFLERLNMSRVEVEYFVKEDNSDMHKKVVEVLTGDKAENYWERHINFIKIDYNKCPRYKELFKASFWNGFYKLIKRPVITNEKWIENLRACIA